MPPRSVSRVAAPAKKSEPEMPAVGIRSLLGSKPRRLSSARLAATVPAQRSGPSGGVWNEVAIPAAVPRIRPAEPRYDHVGAPPLGNEGSTYSAATSRARSFRTR